MIRIYLYFTFLMFVSCSQSSIKTDSKSSENPDKISSEEIIYKKGDSLVEYFPSGQIKRVTIYTGEKLFEMWCYNQIRDYYEDGQIKEIYLSDLDNSGALSRTYEDKAFFPNGKTEFHEFVTVQNPLLKVRLDYYINGQLKQEQYYIDQSEERSSERNYIKHGLQKEFFENGQLYKVEYDSAGFLLGKKKEFYDNGNIAMEENYARFIYYNSFGDRSHIETKLDGVRKEYFGNGNIKVEEFYKEGVHNGQRKEYYESGKKLSITTYESSGEYEGGEKLYEDFYENGNPKQIKCFRGGGIVIHWITFNENGEKINDDWFDTQVR
jgi:antitoxin component YwqK of YwqJK toxin-antitoxin module